jgi:hypothetical protein
MAGQDWDTTASLWPNKTARQNYLQNYLQNYGRTRLLAGHCVSIFASICVALTQIEANIDATQIDANLNAT